MQDATTALTDAQDALKKQTCAAPSSQASPLAQAYLDAALACDSENETAQALAAADTKSGPQKLAASWDDTYTSVIEPFVDLAIAALVIVLVLLTLARLFIGWIDFSGGLASIDPMSRQTKAVVGWLLLAAAALVGTAAWGGWTTSQYWPWGVVAAVLCGLLGAFLLAWAWSQGRSVAVSVMNGDGDEDRAASAHVAALLFDLGQPRRRAWRSRTVPTPRAWPPPGSPPRPRGGWRPWPTGWRNCWHRRTPGRCGSRSPVRTCTR